MARVAGMFIVECAVCEFIIKRSSNQSRKKNHNSHLHLPAQIDLALVVQQRDLVLLGGSEKLLRVRVHVLIRDDACVHEREQRLECGG